MKLTYAQMEGALVALHGVSDSHRIALKGRIKHFQRSGWPRGTNTGKGRPATYNFERALGLTLAFEASQIGVAPDRVVRVLDRSWPRIREATAVVLTTPDTVNEPSKFVYLYCDPNALSGLSDDEPGSLIASELDWRFGTPLAHLFVTQRDMPRRLALINLTQLIHDLWLCLRDNTAVSKNLEHAYAEWMDRL